jgi:hypothetical protein
MTALMIILLLVLAPIWLPIVMFLALIAMMLIGWFFGAPISISVGGKQVGKIVWFKYYRV